MVKLSVSKAARILGISRFDIQEQINSGKLQTHEGYVTTDSLRLAYPNMNLCSEQDKHIEKMRRIKQDAMLRAGSVDAAHSANEKTLLETIATLKHQLHKAEVKNQHFHLVFAELTERLAWLETHCHADDKEPLHQLQDWFGRQH